MRGSYDLTGALHEQWGSPSKHWQDRAARPREGFFFEIDWHTVAAFLDGLWQRLGFNGPPPSGLNRHWVLHGRRPTVGGHADALRLLAELEFIADASRYLKRMPKAWRSEAAIAP